MCRRISLACLPAFLFCWVLTVLWPLSLCASDLLISEVLFNPPGPDAPNAFIELRGTPNSVLPEGTFFVAIAGDTNSNPGTIQNMFDLSGRVVGGNGFLVLLQKGHTYSPDTNATLLVNTGSGAGFGSGSSSSIDHRGNSGQTDLEHASVTFLLLQTTNTPQVGADIDPGNTGVPGGTNYAGWTVLDAVGALGAHGVGDIAYGAVNFRRNTPPGNGAMASGVIVPAAFTPSYLARAGNSTGFAAGDWLAGDNLAGTAPDWSLGSSADTAPKTFSGAALDHIGSPNFGAAPVPGILLFQTDGSSDVSEDGRLDSYTLALNSAPLGTVSISISCGPQLEISTDDGASFGPSRVVALYDTLSRTVHIRAIDDNVVEVAQRRRYITNTVIATQDAANYPLTALIPSVRVNVTDNDTLLLTELKANPPGTNDAHYEFVEIKGAAGAELTNVYLLAIEGNAGSDPGRVNLSMNLTGTRLGDNGLLLLAAANHPYSIPADTTFFAAPEFSRPEGALGNQAISFLLLSSGANFQVGQDLDRGDNGILEGLPGSATILDAVGWSGGGQDDLVYGGAVLELANATPDAATRFPGDNTPSSAAAWFCGDLLGPGGQSLSYEGAYVSRNFPPDTALTPGILNNTAPTITGIEPVSGVIGDLANPTISFHVSDAQTGPDGLLVSLSTTNAGIVPVTHLLLEAGPGGNYTLALNPMGVGYSDITVLVSDGSMTGRVTFPYAASAPGRPGGVWHEGASDGSTAIALDADTMLVGDDENQTLRLYPRRHSSIPLSSFNMTPFLELPDVEAGQVREVDVEASTRVGSRVYWMGSHSHANIGETRTNRTRIWATDLSGSGLSTTVTYVGRYDYLKADLIQWDNQNLHGRGTNYFGLEASDAEGVPPKAPDGSGFSIEGLAMMPGNTNGALVAFRAPIVPATNRTFALLVPVLNFASLCVDGGPPGSAVLGPPMELDLYGRGIRSLEGNDQGYLLVAGPAAAGTTNYPHDFRLYTWTGDPADQPRQRAANLLDISPEAIVELPPPPWSPSSQVQLLSDNGLTVFYGDGVQAKALPVPNFKKCRSDLVALGSVEKPMPIITSASWNEPWLTIRWRSLKGEIYRVQVKSKLEATGWSTIPGDTTALGPWSERTLSLSGPAQFCRILLVDPGSSP